MAIGLDENAGVAGIWRMETATANRRPHLTRLRAELTLGMRSPLKSTDTTANETMPLGDASMRILGPCARAEYVRGGCRNAHG